MFGGALDSNAKEDLKNLPRGTVGEGEGEGQKKSSFLVNSKWQVCSQLPNFNPGPSDDDQQQPNLINTFYFFYIVEVLFVLKFSKHPYCDWMN